MAAIERFEDIIAWQKAFDLAGGVYEITRKVAFSKDFGLSSQIQRAATSIMANIAEGYERQSPKEFYHFLKIARGSCSEVRSHLYLAQRIGYVSEVEFSTLMSMAQETSRLISGFMRTLEPRL
jgi:four helix bundle protein